MTYPYDLQAHSYYSDGDESPEELVERAKKLKLKGLVLTDHNTTLGYNRFFEAAHRASLETIAGIELTARYQGIEIHMLGYSFEFDTAQLTTELMPTVAGYNERSREIVKRCKEAGIASIDFDELLLKRPPGTYVTKYDILKEIKQRTSFNQEEIARLVDARGKLHVPYGDWAITPIKALQIIHRSNGIAVLAHPGEGKNRSSLNKKDAATHIDKLIQELSDERLDGIEIRHPKHTPTDEQHYRVLAERYKLITTGASDWHGPYHHPERQLGQAGLTANEWELLLVTIKEKVKN